MKNITLQVATTMLLGLFAGGCIAVMFVIVPFWHSLSAGELMLWFHNYGPTVAITMLPMQIIPFLLSLYIYFSLRKNNSSDKSLWFWINISNILILLMLLAYFIPVNVEFVNQTMNLDKVPEELTRWGMIHAARTGLTVCSAVAAVAACATVIRRFVVTARQ